MINRGQNSGPLHISGAPTIFATPTGGMQYVVNLTSDFDEPSSFDEVVALLVSATEVDTIVFNINNKGGYVDSLVMLNNFVRQTKARIIKMLSGDASSAASAFFLGEADEYGIGDNASMMVHEFQYGGVGTASNVRRRTEFTSAQNEAYVRDTYKDFLTEEEITQVLSGVEIYLQTDEIKERLSKRQELRMVEFAGEIDDEPIDYSLLNDEELMAEIEDIEDLLDELHTELASRTKG